MGQLYVPINSQGEEITYRYGTVRVARACLRNRKNLLLIPNWVYNVPVMKRALQEKPLHWVGSAKDDLLEFPEEVVDDFGYALYLVQIGGEAPQRQALEGRRPRCFRDHRGPPGGYVPGGLYRSVLGGCLCAALLPKKISIRDPPGASRSEPDSR